MNIKAQTDELKVGEYMTPNPITVLSDITFADAATMMANKRIGNLVVIENEKPVGILSRCHLLQFYNFPKRIKQGQIRLLSLWRKARARVQTRSSMLVVKN
jgi:signal-transduction protein with cAMP-binding, CBS, and nucleotidyltransferase domain